MLFPSVNTQKSWLGFLLGFLVLLNIYFHYTFDGTLEERGRWIDRSLGRILLPIQAAFHWGAESVSSSTARFSDLWQADLENQKLRAELQQAQLTLQKLSELDLENERLRKLLELKSKAPFRLQTAQIVGRDVNPFFHTVEINAGEAEGIERGMAVVCDQGVVGRILRVGRSSSTVLLVTDLNSRVDGVIQRSRVQVIVGGAASGDLRLHLLPRRSDIRPGDTIVTAGVGGIFPSGYRLGTILGASDDPNLVLGDAEVEPAVNFASLEEVFVVVYGAR